MAVSEPRQRPVPHRSKDGPTCRIGDRVGRERCDEVDATLPHLDTACGESEQRITIELGVSGPDGPCDAGVGEVSDPMGLQLRQSRIGDDDADDGVAETSTCTAAAHQADLRVARHIVGDACARDPCAVITDDLPERVVDDERTDSDPPGSAHGDTLPTAPGMLEPGDLGHAAAGTRSMAPLGRLDG